MIERWSMMGDGLFWLLEAAQIEKSWTYQYLRIIQMLSCFQSNIICGRQHDSNYPCVAPQMTIRCPRGLSAVVEPQIPATNANDIRFELVHMGVYMLARINANDQIQTFWQYIIYWCATVVLLARISHNFTFVPSIIILFLSHNLQDGDWVWWQFGDGQQAQWRMYNYQWWWRWVKANVSFLFIIK